VDDSLPMMANFWRESLYRGRDEERCTIRKDIGFATRLGYGGLLKLNVGGYRATKPKDWYAALDPYGPENSIAHADAVFARFQSGENGAGVGTMHRAVQESRPDNRGEYRRALVLGMNPDGTPRHTLMLPYTTQLIPFPKPQTGAHQ